MAGETRPSVLKKIGAAAGHAELSQGLELVVEIGDRQHLAVEEIGRNRGRRVSVQLE